MNTRPLAALLTGAVVVIAQPFYGASSAFAATSILKAAEEVTVFIQGVNSPDTFGSGVIIGKTAKGYSVLTAAHVVAGIDQFTVKTRDGLQYAVKSAQRLAGLDLAIVQFESNRTYTIARLGNSDGVTQTNTVYVAGYPKPGRNITVPLFTITDGRVASIIPNSEATEGYGLAYSNPTRAGMSGGPVFNEAGEVIAIHGRKEGESDGSSTSGAWVNLGIPINRFKTASAGGSQLAKAQTNNNSDAQQKAQAAQRQAQLAAQQKAQAEAAQLAAQQKEAQQRAQAEAQRQAQLAAQQKEAQQKAQAEAAAQRQAQLEAQQREAQQKAQAEAAQRQAQLEAQQREAQQREAQQKAQAEAAQRQAQLAAQQKEAQQKAQAEAQQAKAQEEAAQRKAQLEAQQKRQDAAIAAIEKLQPKPQPQAKSADTLLASVSPLNVAVVNQRAASAPTSRQVCENVRINTIVVRRCREDQLQESAQAPSSRSSPESYVSSGNGKAESGRYQSAVDDYTAAISGNSSLAAAFFNRGLARYKLGQKEAAIADFSKAADLFRSQGATAQYQKTQSILQTLTQAQP